MGTPNDFSSADTLPDLTSMDSSQEKGLPLNLDLERALRMRRGLAIGAGSITLIALVLFGLTRRPYFEATSLIYVQPVVTRAATDTSAGNYDSVRYDSYVQQQILTFDRPDILGHAVDALPPAIRAGLSPDRDRAAKQLESGLKVERLPGSYQIDVTMRGDDPAVLAPMANAVTEAYLDNGQQDDLALGNRQLKSLAQERQRIQDEMEQDRKEQAGLSDTLGMADTSGGGDSNPLDAHLADLRAQVAAARNAHAVALAQLTSVSGKQAQSSSALDSAADPAARGDAELSAMRSALGARRAALMEEMNGLTPENPLYKKDQAELDELGQSIDNLAKQVTHKAGQTLTRQLQLEATRTGDIEATLEAELASQTAAATADTPKLQRAQDLAESIKLLQARYGDVDNAIHTLSLAQSPSFASHISLAAVEPSTPVPSKKILVLALALPLAFLVGSGAALLRQNLDFRIYVGEDVDRIVNFPPMAVLPDPADVSYKVAEQFVFRLVAGLDQAHRVGGASTFIFTAASQRTGIDDLVASVASEMELLGYSTMTRSAAEALTPVESTRRPSPEWRQTLDLARTSANTGMRIRRESLIDENLLRLKHQVDFLFIKAQPLRNSSQTEFAVRLGDVTVLVAESGVTTRKELRGCFTLIRRLQARGVAVAVGNLKLRNADSEFVETVRFAQERESPGSSEQPSDGALTIGRI